MLNPDFLDRLRCPLDPSHTRLTYQDECLICQRCSLKFHIKDGFPVLIAEEAELPPGCASLEQLPCQIEAKGR
jgi:uncharacterized protein YbaR (Trm112 family)